MNLRLIKANMHETFLHFSKYILSEKGKIERSNCESKVRSVSGMRVASHFPSSWQISVTKVLLSQKSLRAGYCDSAGIYSVRTRTRYPSTFSYHEKYLHLHYVVLCSNEMVWVGGKRWTFGDFTWVMCGAGGGGGPDRLDQPWSPRPLHSGNWGGL